MIQGTFKVENVCTAVDTKTAMSGSIVVVGNSVSELRDNFNGSNFSVLKSVLGAKQERRYVIYDCLLGDKYTEYSLCYVINNPTVRLVEDDYTRMDYSEMRTRLIWRIEKEFIFNGIECDDSSLQVECLSELPGVLENLVEPLNIEKEDKNRLIFNLYMIYNEYHVEWLEKRCNNELVLLQRQLECVNMCISLHSEYDVDAYLIEIAERIDRTVKVKMASDFEWLK